MRKISVGLILIFIILLSACEQNSGANNGQSSDHNSEQSSGANNGQSSDYNSEQNNGAEKASMPDDLIVVLPGNEEITLYMERTEVENILGKGEAVSKMFGTAEYDGLVVAYTDGILTQIKIDSDAYKTKSGVTIGTAMDKIKSTHELSGSYGGALYSYDEDKDEYSFVDAGDFEEGANLTADMREIHDGAWLSCNYDPEDANKIWGILVVDQYIAVTMRYDEYEM